MFDQRTGTSGSQQLAKFKRRAIRLSGLIALMTCSSLPVLAAESIPAFSQSPFASTLPASVPLTGFELPLGEVIEDRGIPLSILQLRGDYKYAFAVDLTANQMYVFANNNGKPELVDSYFATIGKEGFGKQREGDKRTPVGVYRIQDFIEDDALPELYGGGALPLDFPNAWDRSLGRTGHGIWIHGMPRDQDSRPARDSLGCVVVSNAILPALHNLSELKSTPVILAEQMTWTDSDVVNDVRGAVLESVELWRDSWSKGDMDTFLAMHSSDFRTRKQRFKNYSKQKRRLAKQRGAVDVQLDEFEVFMYPDVDHKAMAMVSFKQEYTSKQYKDTTYKTQFWQHNGKSWELQLERNVAAWPEQSLKPKLFAQADTE